MMHGIVILLSTIANIANIALEPMGINEINVFNDNYVLTRVRNFNR